MKDRQRQELLAEGVRLIVERSSAHPVEYAITLAVERDGEWHTVRSFDNAHRPDEHHEHLYIGDEKQSPIITHGPVNDAMATALTRIKGSWEAMVERWEATR